MSSDTPEVIQQSPGRQGQDTSVVRGLSRTIAQLARDAESGPSFVKHASAAIVTAFQSPYGAVSVRLGAAIIEDYWHTGGTDPRFWKKPVEELLNESLQEARPIARQFTSRDARFRIALVSVLLRDIGGSMIGVLSLVLRVDDDQQAAAQRELLEAVASQLAFGLSTIESRGSVRASEAPSDELSKAAGYRSGTELAFALASSLRNKYGCDQTAIGFARGSRVRVVSVSGLDEVSERAEAVRNIADAMGEAMDSGGPVVMQRGGHTGHRVHKRWHDTSGGVPVASIPVGSGESGTLVVSLRRAGDMPFRDDEIDGVVASVTPYAPAFEMLERSSRSVAAHATASCRREVKKLLSPGAWGRKIAYACLLCLGAWVLFGSVNHTVSASAMLVPTEQRHIAVPFAGQLAAVLVAPGDEVAEGQLLAEIDTSSLLVEREQLVAEIAITRLSEDQALADGESAGAALARADRRRASARLAEIERRISLSSIRSPFDGRIVSGDMRKRVGESLPLGEPMFEIAQAGNWTVELSVPQRVAGDIAIGQTGLFATDARPESPAEISLGRVKPLPEARDGKSVYVAEAQLIDGADWLKPGMEGVARVNLGPKRVLWIGTHRLMDYLRMNFWL